MTRLTPFDVSGIGDQLQSYDSELLAKTGRSLIGIACHAIGAEEERVQRDLDSLKTAVVPITSGEGCIAGFSESVCMIAAHLGCQAFVTSQTDVFGLGEAVEKQSEVILLADDISYLAVNLKRHLMVDNDQATAQGFVSGLDLMSGGVAGKECLVVGCGPVGVKAAWHLLRRKASISLFDLDPVKTEVAVDRLSIAGSEKIRVPQSLEEALEYSQLIFDATNSAEVIPARSITPIMFIAAPGMPLGVSPQGLEKAGSRILHDPLQIGTATMLVKSVTG